MIEQKNLEQSFDKFFFMSTAEKSKVQTCYFSVFPPLIPLNDRNPQHVLFNFDNVRSCTHTKYLYTQQHTICMLIFLF